MTASPARNDAVGSWFSSLLDRCPAEAVAHVSVCLVLIVAVADALVDPTLSLLSLYAVPIGFAAWAAMRRTAYTLAVLAILTPMPLSFLAGRSIGGAAIWAAASDLVILGFIAQLLTSLKRRRVDQATFVATDALTGLPDRGSFMAGLDAELARASRYGRAFTLAYVDLDNFKAVNDLEGHDAGDELLKRIADALRSSTRQTDVLGRLGGDEFAAILPETTGVATSSVLENLRKQLIGAMAKGGWPVTVSIGAVTFEVPIETSREALQVADGAMYSVKRSGKDGIQHLVWDGDPGSWPEDLAS